MIFKKACKYIYSILYTIYIVYNIYKLKWLTFLVHPIQQPLRKHE